MWRLSALICFGIMTVCIGSPASAGEATIAQIHGMIQKQIEKISFPPSVGVPIAPLSVASLSNSGRGPAPSTSGNFALTYQQGSNNTAAIMQSGSGNAAQFIQIGRNNTAVVTQSRR